MDKEIKIKSVSFTENDFDLLEYSIEKGKGNFSRYVLSLIRRDKDNQKFSTIDYEKIREMIRDEVEQVIKNSPEKSKTDKTGEIMDEIKDAVKGLLD